jgi:hypothetical protein
MRGIGSSKTYMSPDGIEPVGRNSVTGKCRAAESVKGREGERSGKINVLTKRRGPALCLDGLMRLCIRRTEELHKSNKSLPDILCHCKPKPILAVQLDRTESQEITKIYCILRILFNLDVRKYSS